MGPIQGYLSAFGDETPCAVLAPLFPCYLDGPDDLETFTVLRSPTVRYDRVLLSILDEVATYWPGIETDRVFMMGFSGGGQFVHRFMYLYPERLAGVSIGSQAHTTALDDSRNWPVGIADVESLFGRKVNRELIGKFPIQLVIGSEDNGVVDDFWVWLDQEQAQMNAAGTSEFESARGTVWQTRMRRPRDVTFREFRGMLGHNGIKTQLDVVKGANHNGDAVREDVLRYLRDLIREEFPGAGA
ncbi:hypothetical protein F5B18DRAFT_635038 [Nemania serpens]|nr:hypothetical protein F5B18DRAFT_635038 [Nemania serpens]